MTNPGTFTPNSIPLALIVQISYIISMLYFLTSGTYFFEDSNITNCLT